MDVIIRRMDRELYRRLKARASLMGCRVTDDVQEAVKRWLEQGDKLVDTEVDADNAAYERMKPVLLAEHKGKYAVFFSGRFAGVADSLKDACSMVRAAGALKALVVRVGEEEKAGGEWMWSSLELSTA
ncbi:MAG: hypothetical protein QXH32_08420 [Candidatus Caldarchaeum sp.]